MTKLQCFDINLHYKNTLVLEYAQIAGSPPKSMILYIRGRSNGHIFRFLWTKKFQSAFDLTPEIVIIPIFQNTTSRYGYKYSAI